MSGHEKKLEEEFGASVLPSKLEAAERLQLELVKLTRLYISLQNENFNLQKQCTELQAIVQQKSEDVDSELIKKGFIEGVQSTNSFIKNLLLLDRQKEKSDGNLDVMSLLICREKMYQSLVFDENWYLRKYGEMVSSDGFSNDPAAHYLLLGYEKGCEPSEIFSNNNYLDLNTDVRLAKMNPIYHFLLFGEAEGRIY